MDFAVAFGQVLKAARLSALITQEQLAEAAGLHNNTISLAERGKLSLSLNTLKAVCDALGYRPWQLLIETESLMEGEWGLIDSREPLETGVQLTESPAHETDS